MANPFLSEIRIVAFNFAPQGWTFANGQLLPISQNTALFSLLERLTAATAPRILPCRTCSAAFRCMPDKVRVVFAHPRPIRRRGIRTATDHTDTRFSPVSRHRNCRLCPAGANCFTFFDPQLRPGSARNLSVAQLSRACAEVFVHAAESRSQEWKKLREQFMTNPYLAEIRMFPGNFAPRAGPSPTVSFCRSARTPRCFPLSERSTAAMAHRISPCRICAAACRCMWDKEPALPARRRTNGWGRVR